MYVHEACIINSIALFFAFVICTKVYRTNQREPNITHNWPKNLMEELQFIAKYQVSKTGIRELSFCGN